MSNVLTRRRIPRSSVSRRGVIHNYSKRACDRPLTGVGWCVVPLNGCVRASDRRHNRDPGVSHGTAIVILHNSYRRLLTVVLPAARGPRAVSIALRRSRFRSILAAWLLGTSGVYNHGISHSGDQRGFLTTYKGWLVHADSKLSVVRCGMAAVVARAGLGRGKYPNQSVDSVELLRDGVWALLAVSTGGAGVAPRLSAGAAGAAIEA